MFFDEQYINIISWNIMTSISTDAENNFEYLLNRNHLAMSLDQIMDIDGQYNLETFFKNINHHLYYQTVW